MDRGSEITPGSAWMTIWECWNGIRVRHVQGKHLTCWTLSLAPFYLFFKPEILVYNTKKSICCIDLIIDIFSTILHIIAIHPSFSFSLLLSNIANLDFFLFDFLVGIRHVVFIFTKTLH